METIEIQYFLEVAKISSIRQAALSLNISPSAISKAINRLESKLETKLIQKQGRNIILTKSGEKFAHQGAELIALSQNIIGSHSTDSNRINIKIAGPELPLSHWGPELTKTILKTYPMAKITFLVSTNNQAFDLVNSYQADFAFYASDKKPNKEKNNYKLYNKFHYKIFASKKHPLSLKKELHVKELINERFAVTNSSAISLIDNSFQGDGWRDDKFERTNILYTDSLKSLDNVLQQGIAVSYLPEFYGKKLGLKELNITHCPYVCKLSVYLCKNKYGLNKIWSII